jgi:hypothetical protein
MLRPGAAVHLVLVTDDDPMEGLVAQFLTQVKALMGEVHVHTVLGFRGNDVALGVDAPLVRDVCAVRAGLEYQQLSVQTGGLRASLCSRAAMSDFPARLIASLPTMSRPCALRLPPEAEVTSVRVGGESLSRVPSEGWDCQQGNRAWTTTSATLTLCPRTCAAVANAGLEVSIRCDK